MTQHHFRTSNLHAVQENLAEGIGVKAQGEVAKRQRTVAVVVESCRVLIVVLHPSRPHRAAFQAIQSQFHAIKVLALQLVIAVIKFKVNGGWLNAVIAEVV